MEAKEVHYIGMNNYADIFYWNERIGKWRD